MNFGERTLLLLGIAAALPLAFGAGARAFFFEFDRQIEPGDTPVKIEPRVVEPEPGEPGYIPVTDGGDQQT